MALKLFAPGTRKGNEFYLARGSVAGKRVEAICRDEAGQKTRNKRAAHNFAIRLEEQLLRRATAAGTPKTWSEAADAYLEAKDPSANDRRYIEKLKTVLGRKPLEAIRQTHIDQAARLLYPGCLNSTKNDQAYEPAARILHYAAENRWCAWLRVRKLKAETPRRQRPQAGTRETLLAATAGPQHLLLAHLFFQGWRISETLDLTWDDPARSRVLLRDRLFLAWIPKAQAWKQIPMADEIFPLYANTQRKVGFVFPWRTRWRVYDWLRPLCRDLGVEFSPHMARRGFATDLNAEGASRMDIAGAGSWTNAKSVDPYIDVDLDQARNVLNRLSRPKYGGRVGGKEGK